MTETTKHFSFLRARKGDDRNAFQDWFLESCVPALMSKAPHFEGLIVNRAIDAPANRPQRAYEAPAAEDGRPHDIVLECWLGAKASMDEVDAVLAAQGLERRIEYRHDYAVQETVVLDRGTPRPAGITPGIKYIGRLGFHADLPDSAARRSWAIHGDLASRVLTKMTRYVQNFVADVPATAKDGTRGLPELYFGTFEDYLDTAPGGHAQIQHDLRHLIASGARLYTKEHVIKPYP